MNLRFRTSAASEQHMRGCFGEADPDWMNLDSQQHVALSPLELFVPQGHLEAFYCPRYCGTSVDSFTASWHVNCCFSIISCSVWLSWRQASLVHPFYGSNLTSHCSRSCLSWYPLHASALGLVSSEPLLYYLVSSSSMSVSSGWRSVAQSSLCWRCGCSFLGWHSCSEKAVWSSPSLIYHQFSQSYLLDRCLRHFPHLWLHQLEDTMLSTTEPTASDSEQYIWYWHCYPGLELFYQTSRMGYWDSFLHESSFLWSQSCLF